MVIKCNKTICKGVFAGKRYNMIKLKKTLSMTLLVLAVAVQSVPFNNAIGTNRPKPGDKK